MNDRNTEWHSHAQAAMTDISTAATASTDANALNHLYDAQKNLERAIEELEGDGE